MPTYSKHACTFSSNIGRVRGNLPCFSIYLDINKENSKRDYIICFDSIHTEDNQT